MANLNHVQQQLELAFAGYLELDDGEQDAAVDMALVLLRQMLRHKSGIRQKLAEFGNKPKCAKDKRQQQNAKKVRGELVRKTNAASPKAPIKPVQVTKKNELRR
ncbi:hypothetical protein [Ruegeria atlantica]|uniref:hypothetical protein n=1 Tax=Ruegeria atlantica TaxID=81569 RepID=UPI00148146E2|nr:hypothetical protein [Ruegeria atlantica]